MSLIEINYRSKALNHRTGITVIMPDKGPSEDISTLYLLHGMTGDHTDWTRRSGIERYAEERGIAVVMPDGENSFYHNMKYGKDYFTYISEELIEYTRRVFRLSTKREKTFICGLSMGGYGAFYLALRNPALFAGCASLSGCVDIAARLKVCAWTREAEAIWGESFRTCAKDTESDLKWLIDHYQTDAPKPRMFAACGRQDHLFEDNLNFRDFMKEKGFDYRFEEDEGGHSWLFWDKWIGPALDNIME